MMVRSFQSDNSCFGFVLCLIRFVSHVESNKVGYDASDKVDNNLKFQSEDYYKFIYAQNLAG